MVTKLKINNEENINNMRHRNLLFESIEELIFSNGQKQLSELCTESLLYLMEKEVEFFFP